MKKKSVIITTAILFAQLVIAQNSNSVFLQTQIAKLNAIQPLSTLQIQKIDSTYWKELEKIENEQIAFNYTISKMLTNEIYFSQYFQDEIAKRAWVIYQDDINYYQNTVKLSLNSLNEIKPILKTRSEEIALCEVRYFENQTKRNEEKEKISEKYNNQLSAVTLKNKSIGATYNLGLVLENRERLKLSDVQVDSIVSSALQINTLSKNGIITKEKNNRWEYERQYILKFLNEEQVSDFLTIRNLDYAKSYAEKQWKEMQEYNISFEYDSTKTIQEIIVYQLNKEKLKYVYKDEPDKLKELDDYLYKTSYPKALKHLRIEKRKRTSQEATEKNELIF